MYPLEPKEPEQFSRLNPAAGSLVCFAVTFFPLALGILLSLRLNQGNMAWLMWRAPLAIFLFAFTLRLFRLCNSKHLALSLLPTAVATQLVFKWANPDMYFEVLPFLLFMGVVLFVGETGMSFGGWFARRTDSLTSRRTVFLMLLMGVLFITVGPCLCWLAIERITSFRAEAMKPAQFKANANDLERTVIVPILDAPLSVGTNVIWCGTMQLAWNELCSLVGEDVHMENEDRIAGRLNMRSVTTNNFDEKTCLVTSELANNTSLSDLRTRVAAKFDGAVTPDLIPSVDILAKNSVVLYSCLFVNMPFEWAFDRLRKPLRFGQENVATFGIDGDLGISKRARSVRAQVKVCDIRGKDDFVVELKTKRSTHQLILAKIPPEATLIGAVNSVLKRITVPQFRSPPRFDRLIIPVADYDLARGYPELVGRALRVKNPLFSDMPIVAANQSIRFKLDESGAVLKSEARIVLGGISVEDPPDLIFDKPFLVLLKCTTSDKPYFAMWVDNPEVLVKFGKDVR